jgi:hypothetical protein
VSYTQGALKSEHQSPSSGSTHISSDEAKAIIERFMGQQALSSEPTVRDVAEALGTSESRVVELLRELRAQPVQVIQDERRLPRGLIAVTLVLALGAAFVAGQSTTRQASARTPLPPTLLPNPPLFMTRPVHEVVTPTLPPAGYGAVVSGTNGGLRTIEVEGAIQFDEDTVSQLAKAAVNVWERAEREQRINPGGTLHQRIGPADEWNTDIAPPSSPGNYAVTLIFPGGNKTFYVADLRTQPENRQDAVANLIREKIRKEAAIVVERARQMQP